MIESIYIASKSGEPMRRVSEVRAIAGVGLGQDRYATSAGLFPDNGKKERQVTFIAREAIEAASMETGTAYDAPMTRRNVVTLGVEDLNELIGEEFAIGDAQFLGVEECVPCAYPGRLANRPGFVAAFRNRGGLRARVLESGLIAMYDDIKVAAQVG